MFRYQELVGVISYGIGCKSTYEGGAIPGVYGRVSSVVDWIREETSDGKFCKKPSARPVIRRTSNRNKRCRCGIKSAAAAARITIDTKITGGEEADKNEFPWVAFVRIVNRGKETRCGGTLVNNRSKM